MAPFERELPSAKREARTGEFGRRDGSKPKEPRKSQEGSDDAREKIAGGDPGAVGSIPDITRFKPTLIFYLKYRPSLGKCVAGLAGDLFEIVFRKVKHLQGTRIERIRHAVDAETDSQC